MPERRRERLDALAGEHRAGQLDRGGDDDRQADAGLVEDPADAGEGGLDGARVVLRLQHEQVGAAGDEAARPSVVDVRHLVERDAAGDRERFRRRAHVSGDEAGARRRAVRVRDLAGEAGGRLVDLVRAAREAELGEDDRAAAERVRGDDVGAGLEVAAMGVGDDVGARDVELLGAAFVLGAAEIGRAEVAAVDVRAVRPADDEDALGERIEERLRAIVAVHWNDMVSGGGLRLEAGSWKWERRRATPGL